MIQTSPTLQYPNSKTQNKYKKRTNRKSKHKKRTNYQLNKKSSEKSCDLGTKTLYNAFENSSENIWKSTPCDALIESFAQVADNESLSSRTAAIPQILQL